ncbi:hypothetical protein [Niabella aurantiaca]|uniref:hypothetical protein n=1 Tax=Niabella aurantiaca TaxID=379900 RepID=UPI0003713350|nr:hypothetical protein [Niabella aurantiaca]
MARKKKIVTAKVNDVVKNKVPVKNGTVKGNHIQLKEAGTIILAVEDAGPGVNADNIAFTVNETPDTPVQFNWIYRLLDGEPGFDASQAVNGQTTRTQINFPKVVEGGGLAWAEPFVKTPSNRAPNGYYISAKGNNPGLLSVSWRENNADHNGAIIDGSDRLLGDNVELHAYTRAMYGANVELELFTDNVDGYFDGDTPVDIYGQRQDVKFEELPDPEERGISAEEKAKREKNREAQNEQIATTKQFYKLSTNTFTAQVSVYKVLADEQKRPGDKAVVGGLVVPKDEEPDQHALFVQKAVFAINLDPLWQYALSSGSTKLYARVYRIGGDKREMFDEQFIIIDNKKRKQDAGIVGNKVVTQGAVPVNIKRFEHCFYPIITLKEGDKAEKEIFNEKEIEAYNPQLNFDVVTGDRNIKKTVVVEVKQLSGTDADCIANPKHVGRVIDFRSLLTNGYKDGGKLPEKKEEDEKSKQETTTGFYGIKSKEETPPNQPASGNVVHSDSHLEFDAFYDYPFYQNGAVRILELRKFVWMPDIPIKKYDVQISTCRWSHLLRLGIYPDLKWSLVFGLNVQKEHLETFVPRWRINKKVERYEEQLGRFVKKKNSEISTNARHEIERKEKARFREETGVGRARGSKAEPPKKTLAALLDILKEADVSVSSQWNNDTVEKSITDEFVKQLYNQVSGLKRAITFVKDLIEGKIDQGSIDEEMKSRYETFIKSIKQKPTEIELVYPEIAIAFEWQFEKVDEKLVPSAKRAAVVDRVGLGLKTKIEVKPLIGLEIRWHLLDLLARRHPVAYAVLVALKGVVSLIGGDPTKDVIVDFWAKGEIGGAFNLDYNFLGKTKDTNVKGDIAIQIGVDLKFMINGRVIVGKYGYVTKLGFGAGASVGFGCGVNLGMDNVGPYLELEASFEGLILYFEVVADNQIIERVRNDKGQYEDKEIIGGNLGVKGKITLGDGKASTDKIYYKCDTDY